MEYEIFNTGNVKISMHVNNSIYLEVSKIYRKHLHIHTKMFIIQRLSLYIFIYYSFIACSLLLRVVNHLCYNDRMQPHHLFWLSAALKHSSSLLSAISRILSIYVFVNRPRSLFFFLRGGGAFSLHNVISSMYSVYKDP